MSLPSYKDLPVCKRHSLRGLYGVIAEEYDLPVWDSLDVSVRRSKRKVYDYLAGELNLVSWYELDVPLRRSTRLLYNFIVVCADPTTPTLTVVVNGTDGVLSGATVTIGGESETTGDDGKASFEVEYGDYEATVEASGYVSATEELKFRSNKKTFTITLEAEPTPTSSTVTIECLVGGEPAPAGGMFVVSSEEIDMQNPDFTKVLGVSLTGGDGIVRVFDTQTMQPTEEVASIPLGTVYINFDGGAIVNDPKTIDSAEQTITYELQG